MAKRKAPATSPLHVPRPPPRTPDDLGAALHDVGLRRTGPRVAVLARLERATGPVSHGDLAEALAPEGYDRATVYRNLIDLTEAGLVTRTDMGDHVWRFELRKGGAPHGEHAHFLCVDCGAVACLPADAVRVVASKVPNGGEPLDVQVRGRCARCARA